MRPLRGLARRRLERAAKYLYQSGVARQLSMDMTDTGSAGFHGSHPSIGSDRADPANKLCHDVTLSSRLALMSVARAIRSRMSIEERDELPLSVIQHWCQETKPNGERKVADGLGGGSQHLKDPYRKNEGCGRSM
jgi:hypothetical protein